MKDLKGEFGNLKDEFAGEGVVEIEEPFEVERAATATEDTRAVVVEKEEEEEDDWDWE